MALALALAACAATPTAGPSATPNAQAQALHDVHRAAHDMKGQGSTFNYPLVTAIGASLCRLVKERSAAFLGLDRLVGAHVDALQRVIEQEISGDGPESIQAAVASLDHAVTEALSTGIHSYEFNVVLRGT